MRAIILGQGYVGKAMSDLLDSNARSGALYVYDPLNHSKKVKKLLRSKEYDLAIICVPTKQNKDGSCDISIVRKSIREFNAKRYLIKSTVEPGTTEKLAKKYKKRIVFSPEYVGESKYFNPLFPDKMIETPFFIFGGEKEDTSWMVDFFLPILGPTKEYLQMSSKEAEIVKYMENSFFATKITFSQEMYDLCIKVGADWNSVREGWLADPRVGRMHTAVFPENRGFSGKCLPKDTSALRHYMKKNKCDYTLMDAVIKKNKRLLKLNKRKPC